MATLYRMSVAFSRCSMLHSSRCVVLRPSPPFGAAMMMSVRKISCTTALSSKDRHRDRRRNLDNRSVLDKFDDFVLSVLKRWPFLRDYYHQMGKGFRRQGSDFKTWYSMWKKQNANPRYQTTYQEHKAVFDVKGSLLKTSVLLPLFLLPMGIVIVFIPVALFPQFMLPHCYWNLNQRKKFFMTMGQTRTIQEGLILHHLTYLGNSHSSSELQLILEPVIRVVNGSKIPSDADLLRLRNFCRGFENPLNMGSLPPVLLSALCHINFLWKWLPPGWLAYYLNRRAMLILEFDEKLRKENLIYHLPEDELQDATFIRGLDCAALSKEANQYWLKNWVNHTRDCTASDSSYILHAMILLSRNYNELKFQRRVFDGL